MQIITAWHRSSPALTVNDFKKHCKCSTMDETDDMLHNGCQGDGNVRSVRETKTLGPVMLIGKGR